MVNILVNGTKHEILIMEVWKVFRSMWFVAFEIQNKRFNSCCAILLHCCCTGGGEAYYFFVFPPIAQTKLWFPIVISNWIVMRQFWDGSKKQKITSKTYNVPSVWCWCDVKRLEHQMLYPPENYHCHLVGWGWPVHPGTLH